MTTTAILSHNAELRVLRDKRHQHARQRSAWRAAWPDDDGAAAPKEPLRPMHSTDANALLSPTAAGRIAAVR